MKRILIIVLVALAGIGLFAYPAVSNYIFARNCSTATQEYDDTIAKLGAEALEKAWQEAVIYNENLEGNPVHDPFLKGSGMVMADNYFEVLNQHGDGVMGYVDIPKIAVKIPIYHGTSEATLLKGVGHLEGSSMPIGGPGSHSVLTGHTGLVNAKLFTDLVKLSEGDVFYLHILDKTLAYKVDQIKVVLPEDTGDLRRTPEIDYSTLVTCTPYGINSHRLLVRGERTEYVPGEAESTPIAAVIARFKDWDMLIGLAVGLVLLFLIVIFIIVFRRKKQKKDAQAQEALTSPAERSDNPWEITTTSLTMPAQTPGGKKTRNSKPRKRPRRRLFRSRRKKFWWEEKDGRG